MKRVQLTIKSVNSENNNRHAGQMCSTRTNATHLIPIFEELYELGDRLCGLVVRVSGYRYRGPGFDPRRYQIF